MSISAPSQRLGSFLSDGPIVASNGSFSPEMVDGFKYSEVLAAKNGPRGNASDAAMKNQLT